MVDLPTEKQVPLDTIQAPQERVSGGDVARSGEALAQGMGELGQGLDKLSVPLAENQAAADLANQRVTLNADGTPSVATPQTSFLFGSAGEAYAHAMAAGTSAAYANQIMEHMADLHQQFPMDPQGFRTAANTWLQTKTAGLSGPVQQAVAEEGARTIAGHYDNLVSAKATYDVDQAKGNILANIDAQKNQLIGLARQAGTGTPEFQAAQAKLDASYDALGTNPRFGVAPDRIALEKSQTTALLQGEATDAAIDRTFNRKGRAEAQQELESSIWNNPNLSETDRSRLYHQGLAHLEYLSTGQRADIAANKAAVEAMEGGLYKGAVRPEDPAVDMMLGQSKDIGDVEGVQRISAARAAAQHSRPFAGLNDQQTQAAVGIPTAANADRDLMIRTVYGEAGNEPDVGKAAVASVIRNRVQSGQYGPNLRSVILAPKQFSLWNAGDPAGAAARGLSPDSPAYQRIGQIVDAVMGGKVGDPTGGADHYYNPHVAAPDWGDRLGSLNDVTIGNHRFVGRVGAGTPRSDAQITADIAKLLPPTDPRTTASAGSGAMTEWEIHHGYGTTPDGTPAAPPSYAKANAGKPWFTPAELAANPYLMSAYVHTMAGDPDDRVSTGKQIGEAALNALGSDITPAARDLAHFQQLAEQYPDKLGDLADKVNGKLKADQQAGLMGGAPMEAYAADVMRQAQGADIHTANFAAAFKAQVDHREENLREHPLDEAQRRGWAPAPAPLDPQNPQSWGPAIMQRGVIAGKIGSFTGNAAQPVFDKTADLPMVKSIIGTGTAEQKLALLDPLSKLPDPVRAATFAQLGGGDKEAQVFGVAGSVNGADPQAAADILKGQELLKANPNFGPKPEDRDTKGSATMPTTDFPPGVLGSVNAAAEAYYAKLSADANDTSRTWSDSRWEAAVDKVTGGVVDYKGTKVIVPSYGMPESDFRGVLSGLTDADLANTRLSNGQPLPASSLQPSMWGSGQFRLLSYGPGTYRIVSGLASSPMPVADARGGLFTLDLNGRKPAAAPLTVAAPVTVTQSAGASPGMPATAPPTFAPNPMIGLPPAPDLSPLMGGQ